MPTGSSLTQGPLFKALRVGKLFTVKKGAVLHFEDTVTLPSTANIGDLVVVAGILYIATAANTWTKVGLQS